MRISGAVNFTLHAKISIPASVNGLALAPDGSQVAVTSFDKKLRAYATADMSLIKAVSLGTPFPHSVCYSPDGRTVASGGKSLTLFDTGSWKKGTSLKGHSHEIRASTFSPDGTRVYTASGNTVKPADWTARAWDAATGVVLWKWKAQYTMSAVAASPDGKVVAVADSTGFVTLLDAATGLPRWTMELREPIHCLRFTPDSAKVLASGDLQQLVIFSVADGKSRTIRLDTEARGFALTSDGAAAIVGTNLGLTVVDVATGAVRARGPSVGRKPRALELSPDGARLYLLASNPDELVVFDL